MTSSGKCLLKEDQDSDAPKMEINKESPENRLDSSIKARGPLHANLFRREDFNSIGDKGLGLLQRARAGGERPVNALQLDRSTSPIYVLLLSSR